MKKKILGHVCGTNIVAVCKRESIDKYLPIFSQYFEICGNSMDNCRIDTTKNAIFSFVKTDKLPSCDHCNGENISIPDRWNFGPEDPIWEHMHVTQDSANFMRTEVADHKRQLCDKSMLLSIVGSDYNRVIGEFCPHKKILITTDWTHNDLKMSFVGDVLSHMNEIGLLDKRVIVKKKPIITLGADPEFEFIDPDTDRVLNCREVGIQDRVPLRSGGSTGRIGIDGSGQQRELRPEPGNTPEELIANFEKLIQEGLDEIWSLQGERFSCGGHIHIGGVEKSDEFGKLLDYYLGALDTLNSQARLNSGYGKIGSLDNVRKQDWGMEYRTPPVGWLASKELARITLKIVKLAAEKHFYGDDIEIGDNIGEDLEALGITEDEIKTFFSEIEKYKIQGLPRDFKKAWGHKIPPRFSLEFRDGWSVAVKQYLTTIVRKMAAEEDLGGRCVFYGLSSDRGNVFSVVMGNMQGIDMPEHYGFMPPLKTDAAKNHVGMPQSIRSDLSEAKSMEATILEIIRRTIDPPKPKKKIVKKTVVQSVPVEADRLNAARARIMDTSDDHW